MFVRKVRLKTAKIFRKINCSPKRRDDKTSQSTKTVKFRNILFDCYRLQNILKIKYIISLWYVLDEEVYFED